MWSARALTASTTSGAARLEIWWASSGEVGIIKGEARTLTARKALVRRGVNFILAVVLFGSLRLKMRRG